MSILSANFQVSFGTSLFIITLRDSLIVFYSITPGLSQVMAGWYLQIRR